MLTLCLLFRRHVQDSACQGLKARLWYNEVNKLVISLCLKKCNSQENANLVSNALNPFDHLRNRPLVHLLPRLCFLECFDNCKICLQWIQRCNRSLSSRRKKETMEYIAREDMQKTCMRGTHCIIAGHCGRKGREPARKASSPEDVRSPMSPHGPERCGDDCDESVTRVIIVKRREISFLSAGILSARGIFTWDGGFNLIIASWVQQLHNINGRRKIIQGYYLVLNVQGDDYLYCLTLANKRELLKDRKGKARIKTKGKGNTQRRGCRQIKNKNRLNDWLKRESGSCPGKWKDERTKAWII